jgi:hypothetical protein
LCRLASTSIGVNETFAVYRKNARAEFIKIKTGNSTANTYLFTDIKCMKPKVARSTTSQCDRIIKKSLLLLMGLFKKSAGDIKIENQSVAANTKR